MSTFFALLGWFLIGFAWGYSLGKKSPSSPRLRVGAGKEGKQP